MCAKIGIVAPSFFVEKETSFDRGLSTIKEICYDIVMGDFVLSRYQNTTAPAPQRADDINRMFADCSVDIILASDGGCRAIEVLPYLDYDLIAKSGKPICGFSDISHILLAITAKTGCITIHGMDLINGFGDSESQQKATNIQCLFNVINKKSFKFPQFSPMKVLKHGTAKGYAIGGWLQSIHNLYGTEYFPRYQDTILFFEIIDTELHEISMMLHNLRLKGCFDNVCGILIGKLTNCNEEEYYDCIPSFESILLEVTSGYSFPIVENLDFGHGQEHLSFPIGGIVHINTYTNTIIVNY